MKSQGTIDLYEGNFVVNCAPHVLVRLKRVFHGVAKGARPVFLTANAETASELDWFMLRFPLELTPAARRKLTDLCAAWREREKLVQGILQGETEPRTFELAMPLRPYQAIAAELAVRSGSLLLADDVGLGKTATSIGLIVAAAARPALVVTLTHLPGQWKREIERFAPSLRVAVLKNGKMRELGDPDVIISNYAKLAKWQEVLAGKVATVVFDEAQELRRRDSDKWRAAESIAAFAPFRMGLTATPIYNYGMEMHSVLSVLAPGAVGTREEFGREWCGGNVDDKAKIEDPKAFGTYLRERGLMLRRTRKDVGREIPPVQSIPYQVDCDLDVMEQVEVDVLALARTIVSTTARPFERMQASSAMDYRLRQATGVAKARHVAAFLRLLVEAGEKVVLYGWHHEVYDIWREALADLHPVFFTGKESIPQKEEARLHFVEGRTPVIILSLRSGAGLDGLQHVSRTLVFGELDWSPGVHVQCTGRVARDGQAESVTAYYLITDHGSDPVIADTLGLKRGQIEPMLDPDAEPADLAQADPDRIRRLAAQILEVAEQLDHCATENPAVGVGAAT